MRTPDKQIFRTSPRRPKCLCASSVFWLPSWIFRFRRRQHRNFLLFGNRIVCLDSLTGLAMERYLFVCCVYIRSLRSGPVAAPGASFLGALDKSRYRLPARSYWCTISVHLRTRMVELLERSVDERKRAEAAERKRSAIKASTNSGEVVGMEPGRGAYNWSGESFDIFGIDPAEESRFERWLSGVVPRKMWSG